MRAIINLLAVVAALTFAPLAARAEISVEIDVESQTMEVYINGRHRHTWPVSTGRRGFETPGGTFGVSRLEEEWYSTQYEDAPMPHAVFFNGGIAIHGTYETRRLGRPVSHGCVRLAPRNAARLYNYIENYGLRRTTISVND
jgi:lipoprotein-anchoring transpeptidase ErfK/SrfK